MEPKYYSIKQAHPTNRGICLEFATTEEAKEFFEDGKSRGITSNKLEGNVVIKQFPKKKPAFEKEQAT